MKGYLSHPVCCAAKIGSSGGVISHRIDLLEDYTREDVIAITTTLARSKHRVKSKQYSTTTAAKTKCTLHRSHVRIPPILTAQSLT